MIAMSRSVRIVECNGQDIKEISETELGKVGGREVEAAGSGKAIL